MNFDQIDRLLVDALPWLSVTVFPVLLILAVVFGFELYRLGDENVHDVDDYKPAPDVPPVVRERRRLRPEPSLTPIHDALTREPMPEVVARRIARQWLEEIAAEQQAKAGIPLDPLAQRLRRMLDRLPHLRPGHDRRVPRGACRMMLRRIADARLRAAQAAKHEARERARTAERRLNASESEVATLRVLVATWQRIARQAQEQLAAERARTQETTR